MGRPKRSEDPSAEPEALPEPLLVPVEGHATTKLCFVTVGATASFTKLIRAVLVPSFLEALHKHHYTDLRIQYGKDGDQIYSKSFWNLDEDVISKSGVRITGFDFNRDGLRQEMLSAKRRYPESTLQGVEGCMISHAGSGSILDALAISLPTIVVPNTDLLDNHQEELARELSNLNYVTYGDIDHLVGAMDDVEVLRQKMAIWPPVMGASEKTPREKLMDVLDDELGWID